MKVAIATLSPSKNIINFLYIGNSSKRVQEALIFFVIGGRCLRATVSSEKFKVALNILLQYSAVVLIHQSTSANKRL